MKRLFTWKVLRRLLIGFAGLITLVAVIWAVENFRGKRAWNKYKAELQARGETLDFKAFIPSPVPAEQNFAVAPFFTNLNFQVSSDQTSSGQELERTLRRDISDIGIDRVSDKNQPPPRQETIDLAAWQEFFRGNTNYPQPVKVQSAAEDVLLALSRFDGDVNDLRQAAKERPLTRFPIHHEDGFRVLLPHLAPMKGIIRVLELRSTANLELGRTEEAFLDAQVALRLADAMKHEPMLISHLVRVAVCSININILKEGFLRHGWREQDLVSFQKQLTQTDLFAEYLNSIRAERALANDLFESMRHGDDRILRENGMESMAGIPRCWIYQNQLNLAKWGQEFFIGAIDATAHRVYPEVNSKAQELLSIKKAIPSPYELYARMLLPAVLSASKRTAEVQAKIDQAVLACALERYYLGHKKYPESLQELVPQFINGLPHDVVTGGPLKYQTTPNGFYKLYSVGIDGQDDGGKLAPTGPASREKKGYDWVWEFPQTESDPT